MENTETLFSEREYLQRLLVEGVRNGEYISDTPALQQYLSTDNRGDIGMVSNSLRFYTPEGVELTDGVNTNQHPVVVCRFSITEVEDLLANRYKN